MNDLESRSRSSEVVSFISNMALSSVVCSKVSVLHYFWDITTYTLVHHYLYLGFCTLFVQDGTKMRD